MADLQTRKETRSRKGMRAAARRADAANELVEAAAAAAPPPEKFSAMVAQLVEMGFPTEDSHRAVLRARASSIEACIEQVMAGNGGGGGDEGGTIRSGHDTVNACRHSGSCRSVSLLQLLLLRRRRRRRRWQ